MSIVRIDSDSTHGWQARAKVDGKTGGLSMLCSDSVHGGPDKAHRAAKAAERLLHLKARGIRRLQLLAALEAIGRKLREAS